MKRWDLNPDLADSEFWIFMANSQQVFIDADIHILETTEEKKQVIPPYLKGYLRNLDT